MLNFQKLRGMLYFIRMHNYIPTTNKAITSQKDDDFSLKKDINQSIIRKPYASI